MKILLGILLGLVMVGIATSSADEIERICPVGSQLTTNSQGTSFCVDRSGNPTSFSNPGDTGNSGDTGIYLMGTGIVVIIIIAVIIKVSKKSEPETPASLPRRGGTDSQHKEVLDSQDGKCAMCGEYSGSFRFDHIDNNHNNNDLDNCQALCPYCHDRKSRGLD